MMINVASTIIFLSIAGLIEANCTVDILTQKILTTRNAAWRPSRRFNEVYPGLVVGEGTNALIHPILTDLQITHVLNCASPSEEDMITRISRQVEYPEEYVSAFNVTVYGLPIHDTGSYEIGDLFFKGADFIEDVLRKEGRVYVNSFTGSSRAGTIVVGYFMIKRGYSASEALHLVRLGREVRPDKGFLQQLCQLEQRLAIGTSAQTDIAAPVVGPTAPNVQTTTPLPSHGIESTRLHRKPWEPPHIVAKFIHKIFGNW